MSSDIGYLLAWLGDRGAANGSRMKELAGPYVFDSPIMADRGAEDWAVATDGKVIVWALDWRPAFIPTIWANQTETRKILLSHLYPPRCCEVAWRGQLAELRSWLGPAVRQLPCEACQGTSAESEYVYCTFCENDGWMSPEMRPGFVCGVSLDLNRLACVLEPFPGDASVKVISEQHKDGDRLWVISARFRIVQMTLKVTDDPTCDLFAKWPTAPRFPAMEGAVAK